MKHSEASFARQYARTRRFSLGVPRNFTVAPDGSRVAFLRSPAGDDPANSLWAYDVEARSEREVANPRELLGGAGEDLVPAERARRERTRELAGGIVAYACDREVANAAFSLGGQLWWASLEHLGGRAARRLPAPGDAFDPRPSPDGRLVAFCAGGSLCAVTTGGEAGAFVIAEGDGVVTWGLAEFIAAEEMGRTRGFWWGPESRSLLVARVDNSPVATWWTADPAAPERAPEAHRYPVAGSADADVSLWHLEAVAGGGRRREVVWDRERFPYLVSVSWVEQGPPLLLVEQRDHKACQVLCADPMTGETSEAATAIDPAWVGWPAGVPAWMAGGRLVWARPDQGTWRLEVSGQLVTPPGLEVRAVVGAGEHLTFTASTEPEVIEVWSWSEREGLRQLTRQAGVSSAVASDDGRVRVVVSRTMRWHETKAEVHIDGSGPQVLANLAEVPVVEPKVRFLRAGPRGLSVGVVLPAGHEGGKLPVIMSPYGGPGHQRVLAARSAWLEAQWTADQGFAVVVADGRGTPGRGPAWEREVYLDLAGPVLEDQVEALRAAAEEVPELDLSRVGIEGWSFGGYLAALAVLSRPDVFHAAFAGAPVTDWSLYDTYYTERFLGHPAEHPEAYQRSSLLPLASALERPLMLVHGLADDNVYAAHTLRLSAALFSAHKAHSVLPLTGVTHVTGQEAVAEGLALARAEFFRRALTSPAGL
jgi:dipeptidyl-peptidase-4